MLGSFLIFTFFAFTSVFANEVAAIDKAKLSYEIEGADLEEISKLIRKKLIENKSNYHFEKNLGPCLVEKKTTDIFYEDVYFDTADDDLYKSRAYYRVRNRYSSSFKMGFKNFFGFDLFNPDSVDVQYSREVSSSSTKRVQELKLNFKITKEVKNKTLVHPNLNKKLQKLVEVTSLKKKLNPVFTSVSTSKRFHIICENPWVPGVGKKKVLSVVLNRLEEVRSERLEKDYELMAFDIETQINGVLSNRLSEFSSLRGGEGHQRIKQAKKYSLENHNLLKNDISLINRSIQILMLNKYKNEPYELKSNYKRIRDSLIP